MALTFYFDTHIAKAAATQLRAKGVAVVRCEEVDMADASDEQHLQYATDNGYVMVSQDEDFATLDAKWHQEEREHAGIMYIAKQHQGEAQISHVVRKLLFYDEAERARAIDYATEIANHILYV